MGDTASWAEGLCKQMSDNYHVGLSPQAPLLTCLSFWMRSCRMIWFEQKCCCHLQRERKEREALGRS